MKTTHRVWIFFDLKKNKESKPLTLTQAQIFILNLRLKDFDQFLIWTPGWVQWAPLSVFLESEQSIFTSMKPKKLNIKTPASKGEQELVDFSTRVTKTKSRRTRRKKSTQNPMNAILVDSETNTDTALTSTVDTQTSSVFESTNSFITTEIDSVKQPAVQDYGYYFNDFSIHDVKRMEKQNRAEKVLEKHIDQRHHERENMRIEVILVSATGVSFRTHSQNVSLGGTMLEDVVPTEYAKHPFDIIFINKFESDPRQSRLLLRCKVVGDFTHPRRLVFVSPNKETLDRLENFILTYKKYSKKTSKAV